MPIGGDNPFKKIDVRGPSQFGIAPDILTIDDGGVVTMAGGAKRHLTLRADMDFSAQIAAAKPTQVPVGVFKGYSFPIYAADNEELFFRETVPAEWDGVSDIVFHAQIALAGAEDVGDKFHLRLAWEHAVAGEPVSVLSNDVDVETIVLVDRNAQYDEYDLTFTIDHDIDGVGNEIKEHELLGARLRRIAATDTEVTNEIIVIGWHTHYQVDKMFGNS